MTSAALRRKALREAERLFGIFDGTRTFVMDVWILGELLALARRAVELERLRSTFDEPCAKCGADHADSEHAAHEAADAALAPRTKRRKR